MLDKYVIPSVINDDSTLRLCIVIQPDVLYTTVEILWQSNNIKLIMWKRELICEKEK
jgi:hypothetical protein